MKLFSFLVSVVLVLPSCGLTPVEIHADDAGPVADAAEILQDTAVIEVDLGVPDLAVAEVAAVEVDSSEIAIADSGANCDPNCSAWQSCQNNKCIAKVCKADSECNDVPVTETHYCYHGKCAAFQCSKDSDCAGGSKCNTFTYLCYLLPTGCTSDFACNDKDDCTDDMCDFKTGQCSHKLSNGCCKIDGDCNDNIACTIDKCVGGVCAWTAVPKCCTSDLECGDGNPCTGDSCSGGSCAFSNVGNCCNKNGQCDDLDDLTLDLCSANKCIHQWEGLPTKCIQSSDCKGNTCLLGSCIGGNCGYSKGGTCCGSDSDCFKDLSCFVDTCSAAVCSHKAVSGSGTHIWYRFDKGLNGWIVQKDSPLVYFHNSKTATSGMSLRYGVPDKVSFESGTANKGSALSPAFTMPKGKSTLKFWVFLDVEPGFSVHQCGVDVVDAVSGAVLASIWNKNKDLNGGTTGQAWKPVTADVSAFAGKQVKLKAWFDSKLYDTSNKEKVGFVVDELEIGGDCP